MLFHTGQNRCVETNNRSTLLHLLWLLQAVLLSKAQTQIVCPETTASNPLLVVCDPHGALDDQAIVSLIHEFEATALTTTCANEKSVRVHPQMGVVALTEEEILGMRPPGRSEKEDASSPERLVVNLHRQWQVGNQFNETDCENSGIFFLVILSNGNHHRHLFVSVGDAIRHYVGAWRVQRFLESMESDLIITCQHQIDCINVVLKHGINLWTNVLRNDDRSNVLEDVQAQYHGGENRRGNTIRVFPPKLMSESVPTGKFECDACPICLEAFSKSTAHEETPLMSGTPIDIENNVQHFICGHGVCQTCWKSLVTKSNAQSPICCPVCRQAVAEVSVVSFP